MTVSYPIRPTSAAELPAFSAVGQQAFNSSWPAEDFLEIERKIFEPDRSLAAFDGDQMVGTTTAYGFGLTVPGGRVDAAGVTGVSVLPSYRRRGILSALMNRQLADMSAAGTPVAALFSSESGIYGRFGYGVASEEYRFVIRRGEGLLARPDGYRAGPGAGSAADPATSRDTGRGPAVAPAPAVTLRLVEPTAAVKDLATVYDAVRAVRPGMLTRTERWWDVITCDPLFMRDGQSPRRCLIAEDAAGMRGYALYSARPQWGEDSMPAQVLTIRELFGTDPAAYAALWGDLLTRDLVSEVHAGMRPVDDPLLHLLPERRRARPYVTDGLWIRLVDLPVALARRRYACPVDQVIEVTDHLLPANSGRWRLQAGGPADPAPATCERTSTAADLVLPVAAVGAAYLGGTRLGGLAGAGLITELRPGSVAALSAAMSWDPAPWSPMMF